MVTNRLSMVASAFAARDVFGGVGTGVGELAGGAGVGVGVGAGVAVGAGVGVGGGGGEPFRRAALASPGALKLMMAPRATTIKAHRVNVSLFFMFNRLRERVIMVWEWALHSARH
jgi:hypothetical protein